MASFDIVSETDMQEVDNAIGNVTREIGQRFDFKNSNSSVERSNDEITILADDEHKLNAVQDLIKTHFVRRKVDPKALEFKDAEKASLNTIRQKIRIKNGIDQENAKKIVKEIKSKKLKVQAAIRGSEVRITGKKRDDLQSVISLVKDMNLNLPLQYINFRD